MKHGSALPTRTIIRRVLIAVITATALSTLVILVTHRSGEETGPSSGTDSKATFSLDKMRHTASRQGVDEWSVEADTVHLYSTENRAEFIELTARYFEKSGNITVMTADKGSLNTQTRNMTVTGNVVVTRGALTIKSDALSYAKAAHTITSKTPVAISDGISNLFGDTLFLDLTVGRLELDGNVKGTLREESKGNIDETLPR
ncbi:LPS export ABC transporter periplasmic protein LptC [Desulfoluna sp.]|uniref:LPS export ABC transporter periplasmic protein LptC n=1 Tax=Desulfoluna sp. TaxID=2045199 RepID=UPI00261BF550|nr:LPS export ABC transporter periplasmic protein LptC [Desulfoluna sp.]